MEARGGCDADRCRRSSARPTEPVEDTHPRIADSAAPVGVAAAVGLHVSRLDGSPLEYNRPDPWLPDLLVCKPELAERVLEIVHQYI